MFLVPWRTRQWLVAIFLLLRCIGAATPEALSVTPSTQWYGDDGTWSAIELRLGSPPQYVYVMVNTVSSETWAVGPYGCLDNNSICTASRGQIYNSSKSYTYNDQGFFSLTVDNRLGGDGYAEYGYDAVTFGSTGVTLNHTIIGSINTTEFFLGQFGLGIVPGSFQNTTSRAAISGLVEVDGVIPSHSYGYTAGAKYQLKGVPNSLTLGGYDANRFVAHNTTFNLNPSQNPAAFIESITVSSSAASNNWTTPVELLSSVDRVTAVIDSSTPYLWLPQSVCDSFAKTLGLTYNSTLDLYGFDGNASQHSTLQNSQLEFAFNLTDAASSVGSVSITLPYAAFDQQLSFPAIPNTTYGSADSTKYYFPIKRATNEAQYTIGRSFLQEAYLITDYERNTFSLHQAVHTSDPLYNTSIVSISPSSDSSFSSSPAGSGSGAKLATGAIVGIVIGAVVILAVLVALTVLCCCRRKKKRAIDNDDEKPPEPTQPRGFFGRFRRRPGEPQANEAIGSTAYATEVGADASHERFELPAPLGPAELDSEAGTLGDTTERGSLTAGSNDLSAYEQARRKLARQQAEADHAQTTHETYLVEKNDNDIAPTAQYLSVDFQSNHNTPQISPIGPGSGRSFSMSGSPSPVSPGFADGPTSPASPPPTYRKLSPANMVYAGRLPDHVQLPRVVPTMVDRNGRMVPQEQTLITEPGSTMESSLGSQYTENETAGEDLYGAPSPLSVTAYSPVSASNTNLSAPSVNAPSGTASGGSLSGFSSASSQRPLNPQGRIVREEDESKFLREDMIALRADMQTREITDPYQKRRRLDGEEDLVHVPVPAERRFSWEQEGGGTR